MHPGIDVDATSVHSGSIEPDDGPLVANLQQYLGLVWEHENQSLLPFCGHS